MKRLAALALAIFAATKADGQGSASACYLGASFTTCYKPVAHASMEGPASSSVSGYLSSTDWAAFNTGGAGGVPATRTISTTAPLTGGGNLSADRTFAITQSATAANGYLSSTDWNTFNSKVGTATSISTTAPLAGGGDLSTSRTLSITQAGTAGNGYLSSTDWNTFNTKLTSPLTTSGDLLYENATPAPARLAAGTSTQVLHSGTPPSWSAVSLTADVTGVLPTGNMAGPAATAINGFLSSTDWNTFNSKQATITQGNLTEATSSVLTIGNGTSAVIGSGTTIAVTKSDTTHNGYLASTDWVTFNNKVSTTRTINTTAPITGGGDLSADRTIAISAASSSAAGSVSYEDSGTFTAAFTGARSISVTVRYSRVGKTVTLTIPGSISVSCSAGFFNASAAIPAALRINAATSPFMPVTVQDNGSIQASPGALQVVSTGDIYFVKALNSNNFTNGANCGFQDAVISYPVN